MINIKIGDTNLSFMLKQFVTFSGFTLISRVMGLVREMLLSYTLGANFWTDIFFIAFRFPNFFRKFFAEGAMQGALVPEIAHNNRFDLAQHMFVFMTLFLLCFVGVMELLTPYLVYVLAPGYVSDPAKKKIVIEFLRITFPFILTISLSAILAAVLNAKQKFAAESSAPIILNVIMIASILFAYFFNKNIAYTMVWAIFFAGFLHLGYLYCFCRRVGFRLKFVKPNFETGLIGVIKTMSINSLSGAIMQINLFVDTILASWLPVGSLSFLFYADRIFQLPLSVIGVALGSVLLPSFSRLSDNPTHQKRLLKESLLMAFQVSAPAALGMCLFSDFIIYTLFCRGEFSISNSCSTGSVLYAYGFSLPAYVMCKVLNSYCYAQKKPWVPLRASIISVVTNVIGSICLMKSFGCVGLAIATSVASWLNFGFLLYSAFHEDALSWIKNLIPSTLWLIIHGLGLYLYKTTLNYYNTHWLVNLGSFFCIVLIFAVSYFGLGHRFKIHHFLNQWRAN